jgi:hypothetical protein
MLQTGQKYPAYVQSFQKNDTYLCTLVTHLEIDTVVLW